MPEQFQTIEIWYFHDSVTVKRDRHGVNADSSIHTHFYLLDNHSAQGRRTHVAYLPLCVCVHVSLQGHIQLEWTGADVVNYSNNRAVCVLCVDPLIK